MGSKLLKWSGRGGSGELAGGGAGGGFGGETGLAALAGGATGFGRIGAGAAFTLGVVVMVMAGFGRGPGGGFGLEGQERVVVGAGLSRAGEFAQEQGDEGE